LKQTPKKATHLTLRHQTSKAMSPLMIKKKNQQRAQIKKHHQKKRKSLILTSAV
jgi:hypothetical protein